MRDVRAERAYLFSYFDLRSYVNCRSATIPVTREQVTLIYRATSVPEYPHPFTAVRENSSLLTE
jgi:hypothetical protein